MRQAVSRKSKRRPNFSRAEKRRESSPSPTNQTRNSWSRARRVIAKAEHLEKGANPRFVVTSLSSQETIFPAPSRWGAQSLYEEFYCARGDMENRIKEQMMLFADRTSTSWLRSNQIRLYFSTVAYLLMQALRRLGLAAPNWPKRNATRCA